MQGVLALDPLSIWSVDHTVWTNRHRMVAVLRPWQDPVLQDTACQPNTAFTTKHTSSLLLTSEGALPTCPTLSSSPHR